MNLRVLFFIALSLLSFVSRGDELNEAREALKQKKYTEAYQIFLPAAANGNLEAKFRIGYLTMLGQGVSKDEIKGLEIITEAAEASQRDAQAFLAAINFELGAPKWNIAAMKDWAAKAAAQEHPVGKALYGYFLTVGLGVERDVAKGFELLESAMISDKWLAKYLYGQLLIVGLGGRQDFDQGIALLRSVDVGDAPIYVKRVGTVLEQANALANLKKGLIRLTCTTLSCAGNSGSYRRSLESALNRHAYVELAAIVLKVEDKTDLNYYYLARAAEGLGFIESANAYYQLALHPKDSGRKCAGLLNNCADHDLPNEIRERLVALDAALLAERRVRDEREAAARAVEEQRRVEERRLAQREAFHSALKEANEGNARAQYRVSQYLADGVGVAPNSSESLMWLTKSAAGGYDAAQFEMGERYRSGLNVRQDDMKAEALYRKAAAQGHEAAQRQVERYEAKQIEKVRQREIENERKAAEMREREYRAKLENERRAAEAREREYRRKQENEQKLRSL